MRYITHDALMSGEHLLPCGCDPLDWDYEFGIAGIGKLVKCNCCEKLYHYYNQAGVPVWKAMSPKLLEQLKEGYTFNND